MKLKALIKSTMAFAMGLVVTFVSGMVSGQELDVEIINRDGERVGAKAITIQEEGDLISITNKDGKIVIVDADGTKREVDVAGAQSIIVSRSARSIMKDGEKQTQNFGKAIIVGPDGKRQEIELGGPIAGEERILFSAPGAPSAPAGVFRFNRSPQSKFIIGVNCNKVSPALASHLNLDEGQGLIVASLSEDGPAAQAGVEKHDILMFADDQELGEIEELVNAVKQAGEENQKLSVTAIRNGKEIGFDIMPVERKEGINAMGRLIEIPEPGFPGADFDFQMKQLGPGMILGGPKMLPARTLPGEVHEEMRQQMQRMQEEIREMQKRMQQDMKALGGDNFRRDK